MSKARIACLALCLVLPPATANADSIRLIMQEFPPFNFTDQQTGKIQGILTEKVQEMLKRAGESSSVSSSSLARVLHAALNEENTCALGVHRTPEREASYKWVGPLIVDDWVLYGRKQESRQLKTIEDAKPFVIGSFKNASSGIALSEQGYKVEFASRDEDNPRLLVNGRIEYWNASELHGMYLAQQQGYGSEISRALRYKSLGLYLACNLRMEKNRIDLLIQLNKEIDNDGSMEKFIRKYGAK